MGSKKDGKLGLLMLVALVAGNMVGSGAFLLPAGIARIGSIGLWSLAFTVLGALCLALVFAKASLLTSKGGGPYVYVREGLGEYMGFQTAYFYWLAVWVGNAAIVVATVGYLNVFWPVLDNLLVKTLVVLSIVWSLTIINILGVRLVGVIQIITTILKFAPLLIVVVLGWRYFNFDYLSSSFNVSGRSNFSAFSSGTILTLWLFIGVESATVSSNSVRNPNRNIPLATVLGTVIAALIYLTSNLAIFGLLPNEVLANSTSPFAEASEILLGVGGKLLVALGAAIACFGALNGWILVSAQVSKAAAEDGILPKCFASTNQHGVPVVGLIITSLCVTILVLMSIHLQLIEQYDLLILSATSASVIAYFYTAVSEIIIFSSNKLKSFSFFDVVIAVVAAFYSFGAVISSNQRVLVCLFAFMLLTVPLYAMYKARKRPEVKVAD